MNRSVLYLQYTNPANYPPLEHSGLMLLKAGWQVHYFGVQSGGESSKLAFPEPLARRQTLWKHRSPGISQKLHFAAYTLAALWRAMWERPAWVYCSDLMSCPAAWLIGRFTRCRVLYHEHDSPDEENGESRKQKVERAKAETLKTEIRKSESAEREVENISAFSISAFQRVLMWTRKRVGREADLVVLPNQNRLELLVETTGRQRTSFCVYNCPRKEEVMAQKREAKMQGTLRLAFHGSINRDRLPPAMLEAISRFPGRLHLSVVGYETLGSKGYMTAFLQAAERLGLGKTVEFIGALPRHEIFEPASKCDVGLAFMPLDRKSVV